MDDDWSIVEETVGVVDLLCSHSFRESPRVPSSNEPSVGRYVLAFDWIDVVDNYLQERIDISGHCRMIGFTHQPLWKESSVPALKIFPNCPLLIGLSSHPSLGRDVPDGFIGLS